MPKRQLLLAVAASTVVSLFLMISYRNTVSTSSFLSVQRPAQSSSLGIASEVYVISLPRRVDRRIDMEYLMDRLSLRWMYIDAVDAQSQRIASILSSVRNYRQKYPEMFKNTSHAASTSFEWPVDLTTADIFVVETGLPRDETAMTCATEDSTISVYAPNLADYRVLTKGKVACWDSHLTVIRRVAESEKAAIVLEDDVDMEKDIKERLANVWSMLPTDWDMVFLGHCWSSETQYPELFDEHEHPHTTHLHPSYQPKCTHAYVLSPAGAQRLLLHLTYLPFAYSRAIDQAISWLIFSGRIKSFSVVPSVAVQRKTTGSDIGQSRWKDRLECGILDERGALQSEV